MGNKTNSKNTNSNEEYTTTTGERVNSDGHSYEWMSQLNEKVSEWIRGMSSSPDNFMDDEELDYILNNMEDSINNPDVPSGHLTRVENAYHILSLIESGKLKVGDSLPSKAVLRSYSRDFDATIDYINDTDWDSKIVIYRTNGNVGHFNATAFDDSYKDEKESFVKQNSLKIDKITSFKPDGKFNNPDYEDVYDYRYEKLFSELGTSVKTLPENIKEVVLVDVSFSNKNTNSLPVIDVGEDIVFVSD